MGTLYVVATPIGNLEDITLRALRVLGEVDLIAAEDTRTTRKLLTKYDIKTPLTSYHEHNRGIKVGRLLEALETKDVALVSEAGMPGISDPGRELVLAVSGAGVNVVPVPGASALTTCLAASGLPANGTLFLGFLPRRKGDRRRLLEQLKPQPHTLVAFEAPHRLRSSLGDVLEVLGDRDIVACRELTKVHEEIFRGSVSQALSHFMEPRGQFTLAISGASSLPAPRDPDWARQELKRLKGEGFRAREAVATVAQEAGIPRREAYTLWLAIGSG